MKLQKNILMKAIIIFTYYRNRKNFEEDYSEIPNFCVTKETFVTSNKISSCFSYVPSI